MRFDRLDGNSLIQTAAAAILSFGIAIGVCMIAYFDGDGGF